MGISISKTTRGGKELSLTENESSHPICGANTVRTPESQRNDNATKLIEQRRLKLFSPTQLSVSSSSLTSLTQWPRLGGSPLVDSVEVSDRDSPFKCNNYWRESTNDKVSHETRAKNAPFSRPPWKPSAVSTNWKGWECYGANGSDQKCDLGLFTNRMGIPCRQQYGRRKTMSSQSISCVGDARLQTSEAHLRRCSAAQQVQAMRPDVLDTMSLNGQWRATARYMDRRFGSKATRIQRTRHTNSYRGESGLKSIMEKTEDRSGMIMSQSTPTEEGGTDHHNLLHHEHQHEDAYPLRYVFYMEDTPNNVKALANGSKIAHFARDFHCRVYFHAQRNGLIHLGQTDGLKLEEERVLEPALYYKGKRVRPVTVASRNMTELRLFLQTLDAHYPEFEASTFLTNQLVCPTSGDGEVLEGN